MNTFCDDLNYRCILSSTVKNVQGYYVDIFQEIEYLMKYMTKRHGEVFFTMFSLRFPSVQDFQYPYDNSLISKFIVAFMGQCKQRNYDPTYLWVREPSFPNQTPYRFMLLLDGYRVQNAYEIVKHATEIWQEYFGIQDGKGLVHLCRSKGNDFLCGGAKIKRSDPNFQQVFERYFWRASYLAKDNSNNNSLGYSKEFGFSRVPPLLPLHSFFTDPLPPLELV